MKNALSKKMINLIKYRQRGLANIVMDTKTGIIRFSILILFCMFVFVFISVGQAEISSDVNIDGPKVISEHREVAAKFISTLYAAAKENPEIAKDLKFMAAEQNQSETTTVTALEQILGRNRYLNYILGSDYGSGNEVRNEIALTKSRIRKLENLIERAQNADTKTLVKMEIVEVRKDQANIENFIAADQNHFSLLGWLIRLVY